MTTGCRFRSHTKAVDGKFVQFTIARGRASRRNPVIVVKVSGLTTAIPPMAQVCTALEDTSSLGIARTEHPIRPVGGRDKVGDSGDDDRGRRDRGSLTYPRPVAAICDAFRRPNLVSYFVLH